MTDYAAFTAMVTLLSGIGLLILIAFFLRWYARDALRENLFAIRDEMFDYMWQHSLSFETPAYTMLRGSMNGLIRFAHRISLFVPLYASIAGLTRESENYAARVEAAIDALPEPHRKAFREFHSRYVFQVGKYFLSTSPIVWVSLIVAVVCIVLGMLLHRGWRSLSKSIVETAKSRVIPDPLRMEAEIMEAEGFALAA